MNLEDYLEQLNPSDLKKLSSLFPLFSFNLFNKSCKPPWQRVLICADIGRRDKMKRGMKHDHSINPQRFFGLQGGGLFACQLARGVCVHRENR